MELRILTEDDRPGFNKLVSEAFSQGRPAPNPMQPDPLPDGWNNTNRLGLFRGANLIATTATYDMVLGWDFGPMPMGGVANVMCTVVERGQGHVDRLLKKALVDMHDSGQYFSGLHPFQFSFYKRYGYGWVGERYVTTLPIKELKSSPEGRNVQTYEGMDAKDIVAPIFAEYCKRYRGMHLRQGVYPDWWKRNLQTPPISWQGTTTYVHVYTNPSTQEHEGYLIYRFEQEREKALVGDFIALTPEARRGLLSILHYYATQVKSVSIETPADDPLPLSVMSHDLERVVKPFFMARIVDVKSALEALKPSRELSGSVIVQIDDHICDWNLGVFKIEIEAGNVSVTPSTQTPDITLNIEQLSQAFWGVPTLAMMRDAGQISVTNDAGFDLLQKLLPKTVTYMSEFF